jgi:hypothetical protein
MMHYAQSTGCRVRTLREYFGEQPGDACARCDNCKQPVAMPRRASKKPPPKPSGPRFRLGAEVHHRRYGHGKVLGVSGANVLVAFARDQQRKINEDWLSPA